MVHDPARRLWQMVKCSGAALGMLVVAAVAGIYLWINRSLPTPHANAVADRCETIIAPGWERIAGRPRSQAQELFVERDLPGLGVAFAIDGHVVWADGFGWADIERSVPACPSTTFRLGSVSKTFTAVAAARLVEQGRLEWDAPVQRYVPSFKLDPRMTPRLLAAHLAGIREYRNDREARFTTPFHSATESVSLFASDPLIDTPGRAFRYSTYGYTLLGAAIEGAAGASFPEALPDLLLKPLGLQGIWADSAPDTPRLTTRFYERHEQSGWVAAPPENLSGKWAGGGLLGNAPDVARFASTLTRQNFLDSRRVVDAV